MSTGAVTELHRLAHDTAQRARKHPRMRFARSAMNVVAFSNRADTNEWIDDVFFCVEAILADVVEPER